MSTKLLKAYFAKVRDRKGGRQVFSLRKTENKVIVKEKSSMEYIKYTLEGDPGQDGQCIYFINVKLKTPFLRGLLLSSNDVVIYKHQVLTESVAIFLMRSGAEYFSARAIQFNITKYKFYEPHSRLTLNEEKLLLSKYKSTKENLPKITKMDPVVKHFNWPIGSIIKIHRTLQIHPSYTYRVVTG